MGRLDPVLLMPRSVVRSRSLNGVDQLFHLTNTITTIGTQDFWFDCFAYLSSSSEACTLFSSRASDNGVAVLWFRATGIVKVYLNAVTYDGMTLSTISNNAWHYFYFGFDRSANLSVYVDSHDTSDYTVDISSQAAANVGGARNPHIMAGNSTGYYLGKLARFGFGIGNLLTDDERLERINGGRGALYKQLSSGLQAKFAHCWDLEKGGEPRDKVGDNHLIQVGATPIKTSPPPRQ